MSYAIVIDHLTKDYGTVRALDQTSWRLPHKCLLGFLGPNGAGKTTTIRILQGLLKATSGSARLLGLDAWRDSKQIRARVGYLAGDFRPYDYMTGRQTATFVARSRGMRDQSEALRLAEVLQLDLDKKVRAYSKGMRQKLGLILAMMHQPELLILDEPTAALDPLIQQAVYRELRTVAARGDTVLFSSHSLAEVQTLCDSVVILRQGRVVASKSVDSLRDEAAQNVQLHLPVGAKPPDQFPHGFKLIRCENATIRGSWHGSTPELMDWLAALRPLDVRIEPADLEDLFLAYYNDDADLQSPT